MQPRGRLRATSGGSSALVEVLDEARRAVDREGSLTLNEPSLAICRGCRPCLAGPLDRGRRARLRRTSTPARRRSSRRPHASASGAPSASVGAGSRTESATFGRCSSCAPRSFVETAAEVFGALAEAAARARRPATALALVDEGLAGLEPTDDLPWRAHLSALGLRAAADLAERSRARREGGAAAIASSAANEHRERLQAALEGRLVEEGGVDDLLRAKAAWGFAEAGRGLGEPNPDPWAEAASALAATGDTHLAAYCRFREAEAALAGPGDRTRAERALRESRAWAVMVGAEPLRRDVDDLARRARLDLAAGAAASDTPPSPERPTSAAGDPYGLSPREREVLAFLVDGRTNREIGATLFISEKTASVHVTHILDKLGVTSRGAAAALAARGGLVDAPGDRGSSGGDQRP